MDMGLNLPSTPNKTLIRAAKLRDTDSPDAVDRSGPSIGSPSSHENTEVDAHTHGHKWERLTLPINRQ